MRNAVGPVRFRQEVTESLPTGVNSADGLADTGWGFGTPPNTWPK